MAIDIEDIIRAPDTRANQPGASTVKSGTIYPVSDEGRNLERSNATAWAKFGPQLRAIVKPSDTSRGTTTTLADDPHLTVPIAASEKMVLRFVLHILSASATPDFKYTITVPAGATGDFKEDAAATVNAFAAAVSLALSAATAKVLVIDVSVVNSTTPGAVTLQWAQDTSDATATLLKAFSSVMSIVQ